MRHTKNKRDVFLVALIEQYMTLYNVNDDAMAKTLGVCRSTWFKRKGDPGYFTLSDLDLIAKRLQIPRDELCARLF